MFENVLIGLTYVSYVVLAGFLVFLCFRTRSKGVIFITAIFIGFRFLSLIFDAALGVVLNAYMGQWEPGQDVRGVELLRKIGYCHNSCPCKNPYYMSICTSSVCFSSTKSGDRENFANHLPKSGRCGF